jgi:hypothetical protein
MTTPRDTPRYMKGDHSVANKKKPIKRERLEGKPAKNLSPHGTDGDLPPTPEKYGSRASKATTCKSCGHSYIKPCNDDEKRKAKCGNWQWLLANKKVKKK